MKQLLEGLINLRTKINTSLGNFLNYKPTNSHNKNEYHFHGPVNIINRSPNDKINFPTSKVKQISKS